MQFDIEDILAGVFGRVLLLFFFMLSAVWVGSMIGGLAWFIGDSGLSPGALHEIPRLLWESPLMLVNLWIIPNAAMLAAGVVVLFVSESYGFAAWGIIVGFESLFVMLGWGFGSPSRESWVAGSALRA